MHKYTFYIEGLTREEVIVAERETQARKLLWDSLESWEKDRVVRIECVDMEAV